MFLAFSVLLVGWQACYAYHRDAYPTYQDDYPAYHDEYPIYHDEYPTYPDGYPTYYDAYPTYRALRSVQFSKEFSFGVSTAAYQIEGAWNKDGKGENIWDRFLHTHRSYANGTNGDVAAKAYAKMEEDIELLKFLNVTHFRLSLSWSRILPNGLIRNVNPKAVEHYRTQFKLLRKNKIEPFVTLYHWDLPQNLQDMGGFQNKSMVTWFANYARVAFELFGDDVKYWSTFNEPYQICAIGYGSRWLAPAIDKSGVADYICGHNLLKAHAAAWHVYDKEFRTEQCGSISINIGSQWIEPATDSEEDELAAETEREFSIGWFANPIYNGDYPEIIKERVRERSELQGLRKSRLPVFSKVDIKYIKGTHDYFSLNTYRILRAKSIDAPVHPSSLQYDVGTELFYQNGNHTFGIRKMLVWLKEKYNNPSIIITENGIGTKSAALEDPERITYIKKILNNVYDAMVLDDVRVYGYTYSTLMDDFEWYNGYIKKYGLFAVDFHDPERKRTPRKSAFWYKRLCSTRCT